MLLDVGGAPALDESFLIEHIDGHGVGAGGFTEYLKSSGPQPRIDEPADRGLSPCAVDVDDMRQTGTGAMYPPGLLDEIDDPGGAEQQENGIHGQDTSPFTQV